MDAATLDEDFLNFESVSQNFGSTASLVSGADEDINLLDKEASQRERKFQGDKKEEKNNNDLHLSVSDQGFASMKSPCQKLESVDDSSTLSSEDHLFTNFSYNAASKRLTMIPVRYKIKEERRKVLKISVNKLKKIDDPESWLCRSVLINNTMKKLQKETRDEKINKHLNMASLTYSSDCLSKGAENDGFKCHLNRNNNNNNEDDDDGGGNEISVDDFGSQNNRISGTDNSHDNNNFVETIYPDISDEGNECFYDKTLRNNKFCEKGNLKSEDFLFAEEEIENRVKVKTSEEEESDALLNSSLCRGVSINDDFVQKIPSIKRCASHKKSLDEDETPQEILKLSENDLVLNCQNNQKATETEEVDECDVHDVLSQLYMPPTPRMLTTIDSDTDDDELNVVDLDSSYIDNLKTECPKLPNDGLFESELMNGGNGGLKRDCENDLESDFVKRRKTNDVFNCFYECGETYDNFLCSNKNSKTERTSADESADVARTQNPEDDLIELEDEEDIKRRLSQSLSGHYQRKPDKICENFFEDTCDNQYSCGHTVTMFGDMQSVTFHNLIASMET